MNVPANFMATLLFSFWIAFKKWNTNTRRKKMRILSAPRFVQMDDNICQACVRLDIDLVVDTKKSYPPVVESYTPLSLISS